MVDVFEFGARVLEEMGKQLPKCLFFHSVEHVSDVVNNAMKIADAYKVKKKEREMLYLAALFHDIGYVKKYRNHEEEGAKIAKSYLEKIGYDEKDIQKVAKAILATKLPQEPKSRLERILCDADLANLGRDDFLLQTLLLYDESKSKRTFKGNERAWCKATLDFMRAHRYRTREAKRMWNYGKANNKKMLQRMLEIRPKLFIFDFDGVILDSLEFIYSFFQRICRKEGKDFSCTLEEFRRFYQIPFSQNFHGFDIPKKKIAKFLKEFAEQYEKASIRFYPYVRESFCLLKKRKKKIAIVSSNATELIKKKLAKRKIRRAELIIGQDEVRNGKPEPDGLLKCISELKVNASNAVYIGDMVADIKAAEKAGIHSIGVGFGYNTFDAIKAEKPYLAASTQEFLHCILRILSA